MEFSPATYSDLHFVGLDFLLNQLVASESALVSEIEQTQSQLAGHAEANQLLQSTLEDQKMIVEQLKQIRDSQKTASTVQ